MARSGKQKGETMFHEGDKIIYGNKGVCSVLENTTIQREGVPDDRLYYVLQPMNSRESKVFTPVDNNKIVMRPLISKQEAEDLIREMPEIEELKVPCEKLREQTYKDCIRSGSCREYIRIIKTLYRRKRARLTNGKKITATDERYLKQAEDALYSEFSVLFSVPREKMPQYIDEKVKNQEAAV